MENARVNIDSLQMHQTKELTEGRSQWFSFIFPEHHSDEIYSVVAE